MRTTRAVLVDALDSAREAIDLAGSCIVPLQTLAVHPDRSSRLPATASRALRAMSLLWSPARMQAWSWGSDQLVKAGRRCFDLADYLDELAQLAPSVDFEQEREPHRISAQPPDDVVNGLNTPDTRRAAGPETRPDTGSKTRPGSGSNSGPHRGPTDGLEIEVIRMVASYPGASDVRSIASELSNCPVDSPRASHMLAELRALEAQIHRSLLRLYGSR